VLNQENQEEEKAEVASHVRLKERIKSVDLVPESVLIKESLNIIQTERIIH
jgi:hypothetical protein